MGLNIRGFDTTAKRDSAAVGSESGVGLITVMDVTNLCQIALSVAFLVTEVAQRLN